LANINEPRVFRQADRREGKHQTTHRYLSCAGAVDAGVLSPLVCTTPNRVDDRRLPREIDVVVSRLALAAHLPTAKKLPFSRLKLVPV
jgi:hypothetical protein